MGEVTHPLTLLILPYYLLPTLTIDLTAPVATLHTSTDFVRWERVVTVRNPSLVEIKAIVPTTEPMRFFAVERLQ